MHIDQLLSGQPPLAKRAYQLARSGSCKDVIQISGRLDKEGYSLTQVRTYLDRAAVNADLAYICDVADQR